jgi:predicted amidohydrolase YtcJ
MTCHQVTRPSQPLITVLVFCFSLLNPLLSTASDSADIVLRGGAIYTVDAARSWAEALAIRGGQILFVGSDKQVVAHIGPDTKIIELDGRMVLPGFQDSHIHPISARLKDQMCKLRGLTGLAAYLEKIRQCVKDDPDSEWILGSGWSHSAFDDSNRPDRKLLDEIVRDRPITLGSYDGHSVWANSRAMELSGIDESTDDPPSGIIERYPGSREPIGLFLEDPAIKLIHAATPDFTDEDRFQALLEVQSYLNSLGITSVQDAWVELENEGLYGTLPAYRRANAEDRLSLRVVAALYWRPTRGIEQLERMKQIRSESASAQFTASSVKIWQDGVMHTHTSKLLEDYSDRPGERGLSMFDQATLNNVVAALDAEGFQVHIHADGDGALRESLDAFAFAREKNGRRDSRHHVAHLELVHPDDIPRLRKLGVIANVQPLWSTSRYYIGDLINVKLGEKRKRWMEINRSFLEEGVTVAYGSDWFVTSPNPMDLIEAAVTRIRPALPLDDKRTATPMLPGEEVTLGDAIAAYTINGAFANHQEQSTGSLEVGKLADIVVLEKNLFDVEPVRISETRVLLTFLGGKLVYGQLPLETGGQEAP